MARKPEATPEPETTDPNAGLGGSYVIDPKTGRRTLVQRTETSSPAPSETAADPVNTP